MARKSKRKNPLKLSFTAITVVLCIVIGYFLKTTAPAPETDKDFVKVIDVGQAECILVYSNGYSALIDTGLATYSGEVASSLSEWGIEKLDVLMISHLHDDHSGGIPDLLELFSVDNLILPELSVESEGISDAQFAINAVTKSGGKIFNAVQGMNFSVGEFEFTILASYGDMDDENNRSVITVAKIGDIKFLFTGDAEETVETKLLEENINLKCDVLKAGHHGSRTSSSDDFLRAVNPRYALISCGEENMYGHPHNEVLARLEEISAKVYRTDRDGDVTMYVDDGKIKVETEK